MAKALGERRRGATFTKHDHRRSGQQLYDGQGEDVNGHQNISFDRWAANVYRNVRLALNDVHVRRSGIGVKFTRVSLAVEITPERDIWWVFFHRGDRFSMPPLSVSRHNDATARNVAKTMLGFFDDTLSTPDTIGES